MLEFEARSRQGGFSLEASFSAGAGVTALFGRSGAGKSTVLNLIAGLARPDAGRIVLGGEVLVDTARGIFLPPHARRLGYVFQDGRLLPHLTVRQNLLYGRFFRREGLNAFTLEQVVSLLGIGHLLERRPAGLSGGEKQRVAIGRALLARPRALLMDEPLASLDAPRKAEILYYVERLRDELALPIVFVSHSLDEVVRLADTLVLLSEGRVLAQGPAPQMMGRVDLRATLGRHEHGAVVDGRVAGQDLESGLARIEFPGGSLEVPDVEALPGERVRVRIRARDVSLALHRPSGISIRNIVPAVVTEVGVEEGALVDVRVDAAGTVLLARVTRKSALELGLRPGLPVQVLVKAVSIDRRSMGYA